uniref:Amyloid beta protein binding family A member 2 n=1 Tax=Rhinopithecus bieti TaxID=61621 RepID=A0A2K6KDE9_RHIBE
MAHRKRESAGSGMLDHRVRPGPVPHSQEPEMARIWSCLGGAMCPKGLELLPCGQRRATRTRGTRSCTTSNTDEVGQEAVEEVEGLRGHPPHGHEAEGIQDSPDGAHDREGRRSLHVQQEGYQDYYPEEANGNHGRSPRYRLRRTGWDCEDQEEDNQDQIVAEIRERLRASPEHEACPTHQGQLQAPRRHEARAQRGFQAQDQDPRKRGRIAHLSRVCNGLEQPRKQQRSDLNGPVDNNNIPETLTLCPPSVPGPCEPEDLIDGIIFAANYLGSTQLLSERNPSKNIRMMQAQEAVSRVKRMQKAAKIKKKANSEGDAQTLTEVDLFISTQRIKVLNADTQETMMDHALRTISYIADIGNIVVLMARRRMPRSASQDCIETTPGAQEGKKQYKMICHVFESEDAQLIAQSIGQAFSVAYQEFLRANGINPEDLSQKEYSDIINTQEMYNDDLIHFSNSENCKELQLEKHKGEILGVVVVESGWGSILPTVILANMMNGGPAARSGKLSIGDQIMSINGTSLVGLPLATCQGIIKGLKNQTQVKLNIVSCPPVTTVLIKRPDLKYQLGFSVQNGIICSLMRGGIAERGGVRVGHRIIEINGQSVVATAHEKIVQALSNSVGEIHMKTMPAAMFRLLTGQETPLYI